MNRYRKFAPFLLLFVAADLASKEWASASLPFGRPVSLIPNLFQLTLVHNTGAAFGVGRSWSLPFFVVASLIALGVIGVLFHRLDPSEKFSLWGLVLIMSGAIGNFVDRIRLGYVVDFFDLFLGKYHWPAFNVADAAITVGAVLFALDLLRARRKAAE
jgi:signal peptidase II